MILTCLTSICQTSHWCQQEVFYELRCTKEPKELQGANKRKPSTKALISRTGSSSTLTSWAWTIWNKKQKWYGWRVSSRLKIRSPFSQASQPQLCQDTRKASRNRDANLQAPPPAVAMRPIELRGASARPAAEAWNSMNLKPSNILTASVGLSNTAYGIRTIYVYVCVQWIHKDT